MSSGLIDLVLFLALLALCTLVARALLHLGVRAVVGRVEIGNIAREVEHYGWRISLVLGAVATLALRNL